MLAVTLLTRPTQASRWTTRAMAEACALSQSSVARAWQRLGLRPSSRQSAHRRADARLRAKLEALMQLHSDPRRRAQVRVHRVESPCGPRNWLAETHAAVPLEDWQS